MRSGVLFSFVVFLLWLGFSFQFECLGNTYEETGTGDGVSWHEAYFRTQIDPYLKNR